MPLPVLGKLATLCGLITLATLLQSCATTTDISAPATNVVCQGFEPISWSAKDTPATVAQVKEHNASWKALCK